MNPAFDARSISILIKLNYFREFGTAGKLLKVHDEFRSGDLRFSKSHIEKTRQARLENLRDLEALSEEEETSFVDQIQAEIEYGGTPISVFPERKGHFAVLDVDDRYSLKIRLYNIAKGTVGVMKVRKPTFRKQPLKPGDVIRLIEWQKKPAYHFVDGKPSVRQGVFDLWMEAYTSSSA